MLITAALPGQGNDTENDCGGRGEKENDCGGRRAAKL